MATTRRQIVREADKLASPDVSMERIPGIAAHIGG